MPSSMASSADHTSAEGVLTGTKVPVIRHLSHGGEVSETSGTSTSSFDGSTHGDSKFSHKCVMYRSVSSSYTRDASATARVCEDGDVVLVRPKLRGKIHLGLLLLAPVWVVLLLNACKSVVSIVAATISCLSFVANFAASALLHSGRWGPEWRNLVVKLDHAGDSDVSRG